MRSCAVFLVLVLSACMPQVFRADAGAAFVQLQGQVGLQNSTGSLVLAANMQNLHDDLDVGQPEASPYLRAEAEWGRHRVKVSGFGYDASGSGTLSGAFGVIPAGTQVATDLSFVDVTGSWSYDLAPSQTLRLAPGVQVGYYSLDVIARSTSAFEQVDTDLVAPMPYFEAEVDLGKVSLLANAGLIAVDLRDAAGRYWDAEAMVRFRPVNHLELVAGYRYLLLDAHGTATNRDFDADVEVTAWFIGGGVRF